DSPGHLDRVDRVQPTVAVDRDREVVADRLADGPDPRLDPPAVRDVEGRAAAFEGSELGRPEALRPEAERLLGALLRRAGRGPDPGVALDLVTVLPAEQLVDRHAERLALDVPERVLDARKRPAEERAAAPEGLPVDQRPELLDLEWVGSDQVALEVGDRGQER